MKRIQIAFLLIHLFICSVYSQDNGGELTQVIRGTIVDKQTQTPLPGANVMLLGSDPLMGTTSGEDGHFRLEEVPLGRQGIMVSFIGYHRRVIENLILNSARETILFIELEEQVETTGEVVVLGNARKDLAMNEMASVSARAFTVEEAGRYAGSREDVARMAVNFAGVSGANDQRNDIIVRGNTPSGILWRLDGVDIPNPNHFAASGTTGGPVGMLNNNTLRNSDFFTGAFPAEYANVFSGVFDLNMRAGNNEQYEFLGQVGFNGFELGAEGPFKKGGRSSFLANYRYSTLEVFDLLGIRFGTSGIPGYQDVSFKMNFPLRNGKISWFGLAGKSSISILDSETNDADLFTGEGMDLVNGSESLATGLNYTCYHNSNTYSRFILSYVAQNANTVMDAFETGTEPEPFYRDDNTEERLSFKYLFNKRFNRRLSNRSGIIAGRFGYRLNARLWKEEKDAWEYLLNNKKPVLKGPNLFRAHTQFVYKFSDRFEIKPGVNLIYLGMNGKYSVEPRIGVSWETGYRTRLNAGYGEHSKTQSMATYFYETVLKNGAVELSNKPLGFTKARHGILGFDALLSEDFRFKAETYYQYLYNVPVTKNSSSFSLLNVGAGWGLNTRDSLINSGEGWNYGIELTLERFYHKGYYFLTTVSVFDSKYKGSDGIKRNTAFNGKFVFNFLAGKEFHISERTVMVMDLKATWAGGKRYTPVDLDASRKSEAVFATEYFDELAWSKQFRDYFKADIKLGFRYNGENVSQLWELYLENITDHMNPLTRSYSRSKDVIETINQLGILPLFNYRIYF